MHCTSFTLVHMHQGISMHMICCCLSVIISLFTSAVVFVVIVGFTDDIRPYIRREAEGGGSKDGYK